MTAVPEGTRTVTYRIDEPCRRLDWDGQPDDSGEPCKIAEMDHYGTPAGELMCSSVPTIWSCV